VPLTLDDWLMMAPFFFASAVAMELLKLYFRSRSEKSAARREVPAVPAEASGGHLMRVLIPVDGSRNCEFAVRHVVRQFMNNTDMEIHLLNVQPPLTSYITRFLSRKNVRDYHADEAGKALRPVRQLLDGFGIPYAVHVEIGERAECITAAAHRLRCDHIVMSAARKNSLTRLVENSTTNRVLELTSVPVEVIAGDSVSRWERYGIPAGITTLLALLLAAAAD
jgi:nucleotide-binding universal stress UspA family protein